MTLFAANGPGRERADEPGWTETPQTLRVEGGEKPAAIENEQQPRVTPHSLFQMLRALQETGWIQFTEFGRLTMEAEEKNAVPAEVQAEAEDDQG